jgi:hypothetical protein
MRATVAVREQLVSKRLTERCRHVERMVVRMSKITITLKDIRDIEDSDRLRNPLPLDMIDIRSEDAPECDCTDCAERYRDGEESEPGRTNI